MVQRAIVASASGVALALAYPRFDLHALAWIALAPVLTLALSAHPRAALGWGWLAGLAFFLTLLRWLNFTFRVYSAIPGPLVYVPTVTLAAYCGLYIGLVCGAVAWINRRRGAALALAAMPFLWVGGEWVRGHLMGGFPWGMLGYSQYGVLPVIQIAEFGGVYAVSFVVAGVNAAVVAVFATTRRTAAIAAAAGAIGMVAVLGFGWARLAESPAETVRVGVMQPSIEQPLKFDPDHAVRTVQIYVDLTRQAARERPDLLVWPETASPTVLRKDRSLLGALQELSGTLGLPLLVGSIDVGEGPQPRYRNSAFLLTERGLVGRYDKIQLVPFGEYVPLSGVLGFVRGWAEFIADLEPGPEPVVFPGPPAPFGVVICYEGIFPALVREFARGGARLMVNMTNDAWFGRTSGPAQHLAMYPLRAVEHRASVVRAANTGISAFIAPSGRITRRMELFERGTMTERIPLRSRTTLYTRLGDWVAWLSLVLSGGALALAAVAPRGTEARA